MASLTGNLVAETYKALLKTIDNDILTASEKQITDGFGGGSNIFIDSQGFLRANKYKVTNGLATQFLKADGSLDANAYLTSITGAQVITALGFTPVTNQRTLTINGVTYNLTANRTWTIEGTAAVWGNITGTLSNQTDLQNALNAKYNVPAGTITQYIRGDGSIANFPTLPGGLPIGGTAGQILSKIDATDYNAQWIDNFATQTKNEVKLAQTLTKGTAVYVSSANGTNMIVSAASNASEALSSKTFGLLETGGATNDLVKCVTFGLLAGLDTSAAQAGDPVWLGVNGALLFGLANKPVAPANMVYIGVVTRVQSNNGEIFVNIQNGFEIEELHDVLIQSKVNNQGLFYESSTGLWKNKSITDALGFVPQRVDNLASSLFASATNYPNNNAVIAGLALKADAANPVFTGSMNIVGLESRINFYDENNLRKYFIGYDSGTLRIFQDTGSASRFYITPTGQTFIPGTLTVGSVVKDGGTASQFLKADGSIDSNTYVQSSALADYLLISTAASTYQRLDRMSINLLASDINYPNNNAVINALALKADAANPVFTGFMTISGAEPRLYFVDTDNNPDYTVFIDSGIFYIYDQTAGATRFSIGTTGNINAGIGKSITAGSFIKDGGTASQFLKADGSIDSNTYVSSSALADYLLISTATATYQRLDRLASSLFASATNYPNNNAVIAGLALKADAANPVFTGSMNIRGLESRINFYDQDNIRQYFIGYSSGTLSIFQDSISSTRFSISPAGLITIQGTLTVGTIIKSGGTASQYLMADGTVSTFAGVTGSGTTNYLPKWTSASNLGNSNLINDANGNLGLGVTPSAGGLSGYLLFEISNGGASIYGGPNQSLWGTNIAWNAATPNYKTSNFATVYNQQSGQHIWYTAASGTAGGAISWAQNMTLFANGNLAIGPTTDSGFKLDVNGTGRFSNNVTITNGLLTTPRININAGTSAEFAFVINQQSTFAFGSTNGRRIAYYANFSLDDNGLQFGYDTTDKTGIIAGAATSAGTGIDFYTYNGSSWGNRMRLTKDGNLGIGIASPLMQVHTSKAGGNGIFVSNTANNIGGYIYSATYGFELQATNGTNTGITNLFIQPYGGNVLIGTQTDAGFKLDVNGTGRFSGALIGTSATFSSFVDGLGLRANSSSGFGGSGVGVEIGWTGTLGYVQAYNRSTSAYQPIKVDGSTLSFQTSGGEKLGIAAGGAATFSNSITVNTAINLRHSNATIIAKIEQFSGTQGAGLSLFNSSGTQNILFNAGGYSYINSGNFGIGTNSGNNVKVEILQSVSGNPTLGTAAGNLMLSQNGLWGMFFGLNGSTGNGWIQQMRADSATSYNLMLQPVGGNVLIGTATDNGGGLLQIGGSSNGKLSLTGGSSQNGMRWESVATANTFYLFNGNFGPGPGWGLYNVSTAGLPFWIQNSGAATFSSSVTATSFFESSDIRLKTLIESNPIIDGIEKLEAKLYAKNGKIELGYFAQDAKLIMPYAVTKNTDGFLNLSYREIHTAKIARLEKEVAELKEKLNLN